MSAPLPRVFVHFCLSLSRSLSRSTHTFNVRKLTCSLFSIFSYFSPPPLSLSLSALILPYTISHMDLDFFFKLSFRASFWPIFNSLSLRFVLGFIGERKEKKYIR